MKKFASILVAGAMLLGVLTGCGSKDASDPGSSQPAADAGQSQTQTVSGSVSTNGSTSMEKVIGSLSEQFMTENKDVKVTYDATGSGTGIESVSNGSCDIGLASRALKDTETGLTATTVALDGIAIVVNANCGVDDLTVEQIASIFKGEITNWKDVGGPDEEILIVSREAGSGTRGAFEEICKLTEKNADGNEVSLVDESKAIIADSTNAVSTTVSTKKNAIGYISLGSYDSSLVTALDVDSVACTQENIVGGTYSIARPFLLISGPATDDVAKAFLGYAMSAEGQAVVAEHKYIPVA